MLDELTGNATSFVTTLPAFEVGTTNLTPLLVALAIFLGITLAAKLVLVLVIARLRVMATKTNTDLDDVIIDALGSVKPWVYSLVAAYVALSLFSLPNWLDTTTKTVVSVAVIWQLIQVILCFIGYGTRRLIEKDEDGDGVIDPNAATASDMIQLIAKVALYVFGFIFVLQNLGIEVTALVAGLGIGGVAIAFALQSILSDLFSSFSIYFDKPFRVGDYVVVGTDGGTIERIGIKTTRLRTLQGQELVISNAELTAARVQNFKRMNQRRVVSEFGVTYDTTTENLRAINGIIKDIVEKLDHIRFDRVHLRSLGDSALIFELVYHVETSDYNKYMDEQEKFNFALLDEFTKRGIEFAYPTQTIYHQTIS